MKSPAFLDSRLAVWVAALMFVICWYVVAQSTSGWLFGVKPWRSAYGIDLVAHLLLAALLFALARDLPSFMLATAALFSALTLANAIKLSLLGAPLMPDDFLAARNLFLLLGSWQLLGAALMLLIPVVLLAWMVDWRRARAWTVLAGLWMAVGAAMQFAEPLTQAMDDHLGDWGWNQRGNYQMRGLPLHLLQESLRNQSRREVTPRPAEVAKALGVLDGLTGGHFLAVGGSGASQRNVHLILLESFWDPALLKAAGFSRDPLDREFRRLWKATGYSHALVPVFGGFTANSEFEALCGFPVTRDDVFFERGLRRSAPCLPRHLSEAGYLTIASHPNAAPFWNRINAYRRIGFETYWSDRDFVLDDMNREFLSDASLYRQVLDKIDPYLGGERPIFNYVLTYFGHLDYPLNERRPARVETVRGDALVTAYANTAYYKSRELMDFLRELRRRDPDGLIALFGDHLPALGPNFGGYTESGLLTSEMGDFSDAMFRTLVSTPLILLDGRRGPVKLGDMPLYQLPAKLLELLGDPRPSLMALTIQPHGLPRIRPLPDMQLLLQGGGEQTCRGGADPVVCRAAAEWLQAVETLRTDLFGGAQHSLGTRTANPDAI